MKKLFIILTFLTQYFCFAYNKKIIVALSLNDCANCSIGLYQINNTLKNPEITFILQSELEPDSLLVNKRTGIYNFENSIVTYSDDLYNKYIDGIKSTINIIENDTKIYSASLLGLNIEDFLNNYLATDQNNCFSNLKKGSIKIQYDNSLLIFNSNFFRWSYYDQNKTFDIIADNDWVKMAYDIYYKNTNGNELNLQEYEKVVKILPAINPTIYNVSKINKDELLLIVDISFPVSDGSQNINFIKKQFTVHFNIKEQKISVMRYINTDHSLLQDKYKIVNSSFIYPFNKDFIIPLNTKNANPDSDSKYLSIFEINKKNPNELILKEILSQTIPDNYIKYKIYNNLHSYCFDKSLIMLMYGEFIYDYKKNIKYKLPFTEENFNSLTDIVSNLNSGNKKNAYYILDIFDKDKSILVLFKDSDKNLRLMEFNKNDGKILINDEVLSNSEIDSFKNKSSFVLDGNGEIIYLNNENCIEKIK